MPRRLISGPQLALVPPPPPSSPDDFVGTARKTKPKTVPNARFEKAKVEAAQLAESRTWEKAKPLVIVALYAIAHEKIYGVAPTMTAHERHLAMLAAGGVLKTQFDGDAAALADFVWWTWRREKEREAWRREHGRDGVPISWRLQFSTRLLSDYRVSLAREASRKG